jgi:hypothetical protein
MPPCSPPLQELHDRNSDITDIKFAPMGSIMAVASAERTIDLYGKWHVPNDPHSPHYHPTATNMVIQRIAVCLGHSSAVTHMDFSDDAVYLRWERERERKREREREREREKEREMSS